MGDIVEEGLSAGSRLPSGILGMNLVGGIIRQLENENFRLNGENSKLRDRLDQQRDELEKERRAVTRLTERQDAEQEGRPLRNFMNIVGSVLITAGIGIPTLDDETSFGGYALGLTVLGLLCVIFGCFRLTKPKVASGTKGDAK